MTADALRSATEMLCKSDKMLNLECHDREKARHAASSLII